MKKLLILVALVTVVAMTLVACKDDKTPAETTGSDVVTTAPEESTEAPTAPEDDTTAPEDDTTVPEDDTTVPEDDTTVPEDDTTVPEDTTDASDETEPVKDPIRFHSSVDHVNGKGPNGAPNFAGRGGNSTIGVDTIDAVEAEVPVNADKTLSIGGWLGVDGGTAKFVFSVDGGNTWLEATGGYDGEPLPGHYANLNFTDATKLGMFNHAQSPVVADLSDFAGQTVTVTFAAVSAADNETVVPFVTIANYTVPEAQPEETTTEAEETTTETPDVPTTPAEDLKVDLSTLAGQAGYQASFDAAGYNKPMFLLGYGQFIDLGNMDLSVYNKVRIQYGCDGGDGTKANFVALNGNAPIGLKSTATSYGQAGDYNMDGDIAHGDMVFSSNGWASGARWVEIDLTEVTYAGNVYVTMHNPAGTQIAISAIEFIATEETSTEVTDSAFVDVKIPAGSYFTIDHTATKNGQLVITSKNQDVRFALIVDGEIVKYVTRINVPVAKNEKTAIAVAMVDNTGADVEVVCELIPDGPEVEHIVATPVKSFRYKGHVDFINGIQVNLSGYRDMIASPKVHVIAEIDGVKLTGNGRLNLVGWALMNGGQKGIYWSVDGENWYSFVGNYGDANDPIRADVAIDPWKLTSINPSNAVFNKVYADLSAYAGQEITVMVAVGGTNNGLCHFLNINLAAEEEDTTTTPETPETPVSAPIYNASLDKLVELGNSSVAIHSQSCTAAWGENNAFATFTITGDDSYVAAIEIGSAATVTNRMYIIYRTTTAGAPEFFVGSGAGWTGSGDHLDGEAYIADGEWHVMVVDLSGVSAFDGTKANFLRYDFFNNASAAPAGATIDVKMIAFFNNDAEAEDYVSANFGLSFEDDEEETTDPTEDSSEPTEDSSEPTEDSSEPTEDSSEPTEDSSEPTEDSSEPTEDSSEPTEDSSEPTEDSSEPTEDSSEPTEDSSEPEVTVVDPVYNVGLDHIVNMAGSSLTMHGQHSSAAWAQDNSFVTLTVNGADPYVAAIEMGSSIPVTNRLYIVYRTTTAGSPEFFFGSGANWTGGADHLDGEAYIADGEWHLMVVDLSASTAFNGTTAGYLRFDYFTNNGVAVPADATIDIKMVAFFNNDAEAEAYVAANYGLSFETEEETDVPFAGFIEFVNGVSANEIEGANPVGGWDAFPGYNGNPAVAYGVTAADNKITLSGAAFVTGDYDKFFYSIDGENWMEIADFTRSEYTANGFVIFWPSQYGVTATLTADNALYNATIDLSAYAGQTVTVYVAARSLTTVNGAQQYCHLFTFADVVVEVPTEPHTCVFENYTQTAAPTCTTPGSETATCTCGLTDTRDIPVDANAHAWNGGVVVPANTVNGGYTLYTCTHNGEHTMKGNETPVIAPAITVDKVTTNWRVAAAFDEVQWNPDGRQAVHAGNSSATHIVPDATATTGANCLLTIKGWAILTTGQTGLVWSVDNTNWYNTVGGSYTDAEDGVLAAAKVLAGGADGSKMDAKAANGRFNHVSADLSGYRGQTIKVTFAVTNGSIVTPILNVTVTIPA